VRRSGFVLEKFGPGWIDMVESREAGPAEELIED